MTEQLPLIHQPALYLYCDGASKGNPGPAAIGGVIRKGPEPDSETAAEISEFIGTRTNNEAEYSSLIAVLEKAKELGAKKINIFMDSELVVKQIKGIYKIRNERLIPLSDTAKKLLSGFESWEIRHIPRELNSRADSLANQAYKK